MEQTEKKLIVSSSPHVASNNSVRKIMLDVIIALAPAFIASVIFFGLYALMITALAVGSCVLFEWLYNLMRKQKTTIGDLSSVVTGLILAFNLPPTVPFYIPILGGAFAILIVKMLFGGLGKNFANPAATARLFLVLSFGMAMTKFVAPIDYSNGFWAGFTQFYGDVDGFTSSTPLGGGEQNLLNMFLGNTAGCIGETSALALIVGGIYLIVRGVIDYKIPVIYIGTVACFTYIFTGSIASVPPALLGGGLMLGAFFMATDYATSPNSTWGTVIYALGLGFLTVLLRLFTPMPEGVSFAIVIMNLVVPLIDKYIINRPFGTMKRDYTKITVLSIMGLILLGTLLVGIFEIAGV